MHDVVVIGAGLAGASAALRLRDGGRRVTIVDARGRVGGRAYSRGITDREEVMEFGGSWITPWHDRIRSLVDRFDMSLRPTVPVSQRRWHDGQTLRTDTPVAAHQMDDFTAGMDVIRQDALLMRGRMRTSSIWGCTLAETSLSDYFRVRALPPSVQREVLAWWAITGSGDPDQANPLDLLTVISHHDGSLDGMMALLTHTVDGGIGRLVAKAIAASGAKVMLGDAVVEVATRADHVALRLSSGQRINARQVIVTAAINALSTIRFDPPLRPAQARLAQDQHLGRAIKLLIRVSGVAPGILVTGLAEGVRWMFSDRQLPDGTTILIAFGLYDEVKDTSLPAIARAVLKFFPEATVLSQDWHDWVRDPYSSGTWVSHALGQAPLYAAEEWAPLGPIHFASSDIAVRESGWMEGAVVSGEAAADAILSTSDAPPSPRAPQPEITSLTVGPE